VGIYIYISSSVNILRLFNKERITLSQGQKGVIATNLAMDCTIAQSMRIRILLQEDAGANALGLGPVSISSVRSPRSRSKPPSLLPTSIPSFESICSLPS
jgi:hypothetical protein